MVFGWRRKKADASGGLSVVVRSREQLEEQGLPYEISRRQLTKFFDQHDPSKLENVDFILTHYDEPYIIAQLLGKYGEKAVMKALLPKRPSGKPRRREFRSPARSYQLRSAPEFPAAAVHAAVKWQSMWRATQARMRVVREAQLRGTLLALPGTIQGQSGWYERFSSDGTRVATKYHVHQGGWSKIEGPLTVVQYRKLKMREFAGVLLVQTAVRRWLAKRLLHQKREQNRYNFFKVYPKRVRIETIPKLAPARICFNAYAHGLHVTKWSYRSGVRILVPVRSGFKAALRICDEKLQADLPCRRFYTIQGERIFKVSQLQEHTEIVVTHKALRRNERANSKEPQSVSRMNTKLILRQKSKSNEVFELDPSELNASESERETSDLQAKVKLQKQQQTLLQEELKSLSELQTVTKKGISDYKSLRANREVEAGIHSHELKNLLVQQQEQAKAIPGHRRWKRGKISRAQPNYVAHEENLTQKLTQLAKQMEEIHTEQQLQIERATNKLQSAHQSQIEQINTRLQSQIKQQVAKIPVQQRRDNETKLNKKVTGQLAQLTKQIEDLHTEQQQTTAKLESQIEDQVAKRPGKRRVRRNLQDLSPFFETELDDDDVHNLTILTEYHKKSQNEMEQMKRKAQDENQKIQARIQNLEQRKATHEKELKARIESLEQRKLADEKEEMQARIDSLEQRKKHDEEEMRARIDNLERRKDQEEKDQMQARIQKLEAQLRSARLETAQQATEMARRERRREATATNKRNFALVSEAAAKRTQLQNQQSTQLGKWRHEQAEQQLTQQRLVAFHRNLAGIEQRFMVLDLAIAHRRVPPLEAHQQLIQLHREACELQPHEITGLFTELKAELASEIGRLVQRISAQLDHLVRSMHYPRSQTALHFLHPSSANVIQQQLAAVRAQLQHRRKTSSAPVMTVEQGSNGTMANSAVEELSIGSQTWFQVQAIRTRTKVVGITKLQAMVRGVQARNNRHTNSPNFVDEYEKMKGILADDGWD